MSITPTVALERLHHSDVSEAKRWGMSDEQANLCRDIVAERIAELEAEVAGWKRVAVEAVIPLEALRMARPAGDFSPSMRASIENAIGIVRRAVAGEGLPPDPTLTGTKTKGSETP